MGEWIGRKKVVILASVFNVLGFVIMYFSDTFLLLLLGKNFTNIGMGLGVMMPFVLVSEQSTIKARAPLSVINIISLCTGLLLSFIFVFAFPTSYLIYFTGGLFLLF